MPQTEYAIQLEHVTKTFGPVIANHDVTMNIRRGEILSLLGENGSGKTTLMNMIAGIYYPDGGQIIVNGQPADIRSPRDALALGIGMIHQHFKLVDVFTAVENIALSMDKGEKFDLRRVRDKARAICEKYQFALDLDQKVYEMSVSQKQTLEIVKVLFRGADILILDEPTNGLDPAGIQEMRSLIASMPETTGATVLISSHLLGEMEQMVTQVGILNHGRLLFEGPLTDLQRHSRGSLLLRVLDLQKGIAVLDRQGVPAAALPQQPGLLQLPPLPDETLAELVHTLAESGAGVVGLTAQTKTLEEIFLSLTQSSGEVA